MMFLPDSAKDCRVCVADQRGDITDPNTVGVIRNAPHPTNAQKLFEYLHGAR